MQAASGSHFQDKAWPAAKSPSNRFRNGLFVAGLVRSLGGLTTGKDSPSLRMVKDQPENPADGETGCTSTEFCRCSQTTPHFLCGCSHHEALAWASRLMFGEIETLNWWLNLVYQGMLY